MRPTNSDVYFTVAERRNLKEQIYDATETWLTRRDSLGRARTILSLAGVTNIAPCHWRRVRATQGRRPSDKNLMAMRNKLIEIGLME